MALTGHVKWRHAAIFLPAQIAGGLSGTILTHLMFYHENPRLIAISQLTRSSGNYCAEFLGTFILILAILMLTQYKSDKTALVVGLLVGGEKLIATSSTMFANPQVTLARIFTYSAAGVRPMDGFIFMLMELTGAVIAVLVFNVLKKTKTKHIAQ